MPCILRVAPTFAALAGTSLLLVLATTAASGQTVGMAGEYSENYGAIIHLPQNPPMVACVSGAPADARCIRNRIACFGAPQSFVRSQYPHHGANGARIIPTAGAGPGTTGRPHGMNIGDSFVLPPRLMEQRLGLQAEVVLGNVVRQVDTSFTAAAPGTDRLKNPPVNTRRFEANHWSFAGAQNNGLTGSQASARVAANTTIIRNIGSEMLVMTYRAGPNAFGGTMAGLIGGLGLLGALVRRRR